MPWSLSAANIASAKGRGYEPRRDSPVESPQQPSKMSRAKKTACIVLAGCCLAVGVWGIAGAAGEDALPIVQVDQDSLTHQLREGHSGCP